MFVFAPIYSDVYLHISLLWLSWRFRGTTGGVLSSYSALSATRFGHYAGCAWGDGLTWVLSALFLGGPCSPGRYLWGTGVRE